MEERRLYIAGLTLGSMLSALACYYGRAVCTTFPLLAVILPSIFFLLLLFHSSYLSLRTYRQRNRKPLDYSYLLAVLAYPYLLYVLGFNLLSLTLAEIQLIKYFTLAFFISAIVKAISPESPRYLSLILPMFICAVENLSHIFLSASEFSLMALTLSLLASVLGLSYCHLIKRLSSDSKRQSEAYV